MVFAIDLVAGSRRSIGIPMPRVHLGRIDTCEPDILLNPDPIFMHEDIGIHLAELRATHRTNPWQPEVYSTQCVTIINLCYIVNARFVSRMDNTVHLSS